MDRRRRTRVPSVAGFKNALVAIQGSLIDKQREMLLANYNAPNHTISVAALAKAVHYKSAHLQYGKVGALLCDLLSFEPREKAHGRPVVTSVFAEGSSQPGKSYEWTLRPQFVVALEELGWVGANRKDSRNGRWGRGKVAVPRVWRMAMKCGSQGPSMWQQCFRKGVAAICYGAFVGVDLREHAKDEPANHWARLEAPQRGFLRRVAYDMKEGDTIYVKDGPRIVGKGTVTGRYRFEEDCDIVGPDDKLPFSHQLPVNWDARFEPIAIRLGAEQTTVLELSGERLARLEQVIRQQVARRVKGDPAKYPEGGAREITRELIARNSKLREDAVLRLGSTCEICGFNFGDVYGDLGEGFIEVHHLKPLSKAGGRAVATMLKEVAVVCANCHRMLHRRGVTPFKLAQLRKIVRDKRRFTRK
jgi:predicted HNH restriction endonuclease